ncbi:MAG TPA: glycoside hydrolase family 2 TIM barrel-domain containing protein, partial [Gemmatimonadaceae bacterium]|nr:glycoside hydrolase family 2 TIM barrel-domain containing protein [Gemmatimonadaceae bacterium]
MIIPLAVAAALAVTLLVPAATDRAPTAPVEKTLYHDAPSGMYLLESGWSTRPDPRGVGLRQRWQDATATAGFRPVAVPNAFNAGDLSRSSFRGRVQWYRVHFTLPEAPDALAWRVRFESVNIDATVWLNGALIGHHRGAYLPFEFDLRGIKSGMNEIAVRVDSRGRASDLPPANRKRGWWNFGGILREVYLRKIGTFDVSAPQVTATPGHPATVDLRAQARNAAAAGSLGYEISVTGPGGFSLIRHGNAGRVEAGANAQIHESFSIPDARLWSPSDPALYELSLRVTGGQVTPVTFGVRSWSLSRDGHLLLNGQRILLRGASFHEQTAQHGAALTPPNRSEIVRELQAIGANFARQHYPPHPALLEAFDRTGIVFWEQIPVWRVRDRQLRRAAFRDTALADLREAILRDRNHASVAAWSVSNETLRGGAGERAYFHAARVLQARLDPTRLLAADKSLRPLGDIPSSYRLLDAIGLNEYVGWYGGTTRELPGNLAGVRRRFPRQALVITEFGAEANRSGAASQKGTYAFQQRFLAAHLAVFDRTPALSGALVWVLRDFVVRPGWTGGNPHPRPPTLFKGLFRQ